LSNLANHSVRKTVFAAMQQRDHVFRLLAAMFDCV